VAAETWSQVADKVEKSQDQSIKDAAETEDLVAKDRETLLKELKALKAVEKKEDRALAKLQKKFEGLLKVEAQLNTDLENEQDEIEAVEGTVRSAAKEMSSLSRDNPITPEIPERTAALAGLLSSRRFPGLEGIQLLMGAFFQEMAAGAKIVSRTGDFVGPDGRNASGEIIRVGRFTTFFSYGRRFCRISYPGSQWAASNRRSRRGAPGHAECHTSLF
jgi:biopolymer transport protein ExbB